MKQRRCRQHSAELLAEIERIVALKKQIPRYADVAKAFGVSTQIIDRLIYERMPTYRTKIRVHVEQRTNIRNAQMTREELDRMAAQLLRQQHGNGM